LRERSPGLSASLAAENRLVKDRERVLEKVPRNGGSPSSDCPIFESSLGSGASLGPRRFSRGAGMFCGCCGGMPMMSSLLSDTSGRSSTPTSSLSVKDDGLRRRPFRTFGSYTGYGFSRNCPAASLPQSVNDSELDIGGVAAWILMLGMPGAAGGDGGSVAAAALGDRSSGGAGGDGGSLFVIALSVALLGVVVLQLNQSKRCVGWHSKL
jgi:hypothetical protein